MVYNCCALLQTLAVLNPLQSADANVHVILILYGVLPHVWWNTITGRSKNNNSLRMSVLLSLLLLGWEDSFWLHLWRWCYRLCWYVCCTQPNEQWRCEWMVRVTLRMSCLAVSVLLLISSRWWKIHLLSLLLGWEDSHHLWRWCYRLCWYVCCTQPNEQWRCEWIVCGQCARLLSTAHGAPLCCRCAVITSVRYLLSCYISSTMS